MIVLPFWTQADWFSLFKKLMIKYMIPDKPTYIDDDANVRPKPTWDTIIAVIEG